MSNYSETEEMNIISLITISENSSYWSPSPIFVCFYDDGQTNPLPFRGDSLIYYIALGSCFACKCLRILVLDKLQHSNPGVVYTVLYG